MAGQAEPQVTPPAEDAEAGDVFEDDDEFEEFEHEGELASSILRSSSPRRPA